MFFSFITMIAYLFAYATHLLMFYHQSWTWDQTCGKMIVFMVLFVRKLVFLIKVNQRCFLKSKHLSTYNQRLPIAAEFYCCLTNSGMATFENHPLQILYVFVSWKGLKLFRRRPIFKYPSTVHKGFFSNVGLCFRQTWFINLNDSLVIVFIYSVLKKIESSQQIFKHDKYYFITSNTYCSF